MHLMSDIEECLAVVDAAAIDVVRLCFGRTGYAV